MSIIRRRHRVKFTDSACRHIDFVVLRREWRKLRGGNKTAQALSRKSGETPEWAPNSPQGPVYQWGVSLSSPNENQVFTESVSSGG